MPQGSTLGLLLFIIYIYDVEPYIHDVNVALYALADTAFYSAGNNFKTISSELTRATNNFHHWCQLNRLTLNSSKCKTLPFHQLKGKRAKEGLNDIGERIEHVKIGTVNEYWYLGVIIYQP